MFSNGVITITNGFAKAFHSQNITEALVSGWETTPRLGIHNHSITQAVGAPRAFSIPTTLSTAANHPACSHFWYLLLYCAVLACSPHGVLTTYILFDRWQECMVMHVPAVDRSCAHHAMWF